MTSPLRTITDADADAIAAALVRHLRDEREADRAERARPLELADAALALLAATTTKPGSARAGGE